MPILSGVADEKEISCVVKSCLKLNYGQHGQHLLGTLKTIRAK